MNVIKRAPLEAFWTFHADADDELRDWYTVASKAPWQTPHEVKQDFPSADPIGDGRMVFNIRGNSYRLIVRIVYRFKAIQIKWLGTPAEYARIDARTIDAY